jgi:hypothetical protein
MRSAILTSIILSLTPLIASAQASADPCVQTKSMRIYSNAYIHEETGDLLGYELAIKQRPDASIEALLYIYEGSTAGEGIDLPGQISGKDLTIAGNWIERSIEYPSKKEIVQTYSVRINGTLSLTAFLGRIKIADLEEGEIKLRRVNHIWACKP